MRSLLPVAVYCISLLCLQLQALPVRSRLDFISRLNELKENSLLSQDQGSSDPTATPAVRLDKTALWKVLLFRTPPAPIKDKKSALHNLLAAPTGTDVEEASQRSSRARRHAHIRAHHHPHHGQLMRVGCVLGTCQVQNLSHRLYQLVGQTGREDSSPINPRSPHSYG